jgi:hypothetical protein
VAPRDGTGALANNSLDGLLYSKIYRHIEHTSFVVSLNTTCKSANPTRKRQIRRPDRVHSCKTFAEMTFRICHQNCPESDCFIPDLRGSGVGHDAVDTKETDLHLLRVGDATPVNSRKIIAFFSSRIGQTGRCIRKEP